MGSNLLILYAAHGIDALEERPGRTWESSELDEPKLRNIHLEIAPGILGLDGALQYAIFQS